VSEYPLQRAARLARRMPGYRWVRRRALPRIRQSAAARTLALRLFAIESRTSAQSVEAPLELPAGRLLAGLGTERLPVILVSLVGLTDALDDKATVDELIDAVIDQVAEAQLLGAGFRPVLLLDTPSFSRARSCGYVVELITPRSVWQATTWHEAYCDPLANGPRPWVSRKRAAARFDELARIQEPGCQVLHSIEIGVSCTPKQ
jgi:hypothetical protein